MKNILQKIRTWRGQRNWWKIGVIFVLMAQLGLGTFKASNLTGAEPMSDGNSRCFWIGAPPVFGARMCSYGDKKFFSRTAWDRFTNPE